MAEQKSRILIVEDEAQIGLVLKGGLERHGFVTRYLACSTDAVAACLKFRPDLVLLDVDMPVKDGGQVASEFMDHPELRQIPVVFLTSLTRKENSGQRNAAGELFLSKPIPIAELATHIRAVLQVRPPCLTRPKNLLKSASSYRERRDG